ncbi:MAG: redoxin domain-containing protein [Chitinophagaceae bacterium]|nr:redoxin domain-containing protein [Chitinophagaceae bacterium]
MKKILSVLFLLSLVQFCFSQTDSTLPVYLRFPNIPQFTIYKAADSTAFTREDLKKRTATVFIIFSPDCEHCQHETEELIANIEKFKKAQVIMVTYLPHDQMVKFYNDYKIADYPEITMARDPKFFFPVFYKVTNLPSIFVYDKKGEFKKAFEGSVKMDKIADEL